MRINNEPIAKYGATKLTFEIQPAQDAVAVEWIEKAVVPTMGATTVTFGTAKAVLYFRGPDRSKIIQNMAQLLALLTSEAVLKVPGYRGEYVGYLKSSNIEQVLRSKTRQKLTLEFRGYLRGNKQLWEYQGVKAATLIRVGARPTPVILTITPQVDMESFTVAGLTDDPITITNLSAGVPITIDGRDGTTWERGINKGADVDLWEPPALRDPVVPLEFSDAAPTVTVEYWPIWL